MQDIVHYPIHFELSEQPPLKTLAGWDNKPPIPQSRLVPPPSALGKAKPDDKKDQWRAGNSKTARRDFKG